MRRSGPRRGKVGRLAEDRPLELLEVRARLDPQIVDKSPSSGAVRVEGFGLPSRPVERQHLMSPQPLPVWIALHKLAELGHERGVAAAGEVGLDAALDRGHAQLFESVGIRPQPVHGDLCQCRPPPEAKRIGVTHGRDLHLPGRECPLGVANECAEPVQVDLILGDEELVASRTRRQAGLTVQRRAQPRDSHAQRLPRALGVLVWPEGVDELVGRNRLVSAQEQVREQGALLGTAERDRAPVPMRLEGTKDAELDH
jgi:hypothetical protein